MALTRMCRPEYIHQVLATGGLALLLRDHALQVDLDDLARLELVRARGTDDADDAHRGVVDREFLVLLERLAQRVKAGLDEVLERAWSRARTVSGVSE